MYKVSYRLENEEYFTTLYFDDYPETIDFADLLFSSEYVSILKIEFIPYTDE